MLKKYKNFDYYLYLPEGYEEGKPCSLLVDLHGAGTRGRDTSVFLDSLLVKYTQSKGLPCAVVRPQCFADTWFDIFEQLQDFVSAMIKTYGATPEATFLSGTSMGGYAAWQLLATLSGQFCRAVICCGGGMYWNAARIKTEVRAFHGSNDPVVFHEESKKMCDAVNAYGGKATLTTLEGVAHNAWDYVFNNDEILRWLTTGKE